MRPGHIHFKVTAEGYLSLITELYDKEDPYLDSDVVFDVHNSVILDFGYKPEGEANGHVFDLNFDFKIISKSFADQNGMKAAENWVEAVLDPY